MHIETIKAIITNFYSTRKRNVYLHIGTYTTDQQRAFEKSFLSVLLAGRLIKGLPPRDEGKWRKKQNFHLRVEKPWRISAWNSDVTKFVKINRQYICIYEGFTRETESVWYIYNAKKKRENNVFFLRKEFPPPSLTDWKCWLDWQLFSSFVGTCTVLDTLLLIYNRTLSLFLTNNFEGKWMLASSS